jgi:hypothetical protein
MFGRPKPKAGSSRGDGYKDKGRARATVSTSDSHVKGKGHDDPMKKPADGDAKKTKESRKDNKGTAKSASSSGPSSEKSHDRASRDSGRVSIATDPKANASGAKSKGPALPGRSQKKAQASNGGAMPLIRALSSAADPIDRDFLAGESDPPNSGRPGGEKDSKRDPSKNSESDKSGVGPSGGGDGGGDPGNDPPSDGSRTLKNLDPEGCILENFPKELRERVFSFMLDSREVQYDPHNPPTSPPPRRTPHSTDYFWFNGRAYAYDFSFELFTHCNTETSKVAKASFEALNKLILVEFDSPYLKMYLHQTDVPIITDSECLMHCNTHAIHMRIQWAMTHMQPNVVHEDMLAKMSGRFLMLSTDFDKLCSTLRYLCQYTFPPAVYVLLGQGDPLKLRALTRDDTPRISFRITRPDTLRHNQREQLLQKLRTITGGGYGLGVTSADPNDPLATPEYVDSLQRSMAPPLIWVHSLRTNQLETAKKVYVTAHKNIDGIKVDGVKRNDVVQRHKEMYSQLLVWKGEGFFRLYEGFPTHLFKGEMRDVCRRTNPIGFSVHAELITLHLLLGTAFSATPIEWASMALQHVNTVDESLMTGKMRLQLRHLNLIVYMAENQDSRVSELHDALRSHVQEMSSNTPHYRQAKHDLEILRPLLDVRNTVIYDPNRSNPCANRHTEPREPARKSSI